MANDKRQRRDALFGTLDLVKLRELTDEMMQAIAAEPPADAWPLSMPTLPPPAYQPPCAPLTEGAVRRIVREEMAAQRFDVAD